MTPNLLAFERPMHLALAGRRPYRTSGVACLLPCRRSTRPEISTFSDRFGRACLDWSMDSCMIRRNGVIATRQQKLKPGDPNSQLKGSERPLRMARTHLQINNTYMSKSHIGWIDCMCNKDIIGICLRPRGAACPRCSCGRADAAGRMAREQLEISFEAAGPVGLGMSLDQTSGMLCGYGTLRFRLSQTCRRVGLGQKSSQFETGRRWRSFDSSPFLPRHPESTVLCLRAGWR